MHRNNRQLRDDLCQLKAELVSKMNYSGELLAEAHSAAHR